MRRDLSAVITGLAMIGAIPAMADEVGDFYKGKQMRMIVRTTTETVTFTRSDSIALAPATLAEYAGSYHSDEVDATHIWKIEKGQLVLYVNGRRELIVCQVVRVDDLHKFIIRKPNPTVG